MKIETSPDFGVRLTFDTEEDQYGLLAMAQITRQCKGSSEDYSSHNGDAKRIARKILKELE